MGLFNLFKRNTTKSVPSPAKKVQKRPSKQYRHEFPIANFQLPFAKSEVEKLNELLKTLDCTRKLHMNSNAITPDSYFRYTPFTEKTGKISKYPCMLHICSTVHMGYSVTIHYDIHDNIGKGTMHLATPKLAYTIDFKNSNGVLKIMKVVTTDDKFGNVKLYHEMANGDIYQK